MALKPRISLPENARLLELRYTSPFPKQASVVETNGRGPRFQQPRGKTGMVRFTRGSIPRRTLRRFPNRHNLPRYTAWRRLGKASGRPTGSAEGSTEEGYKNLFFMGGARVVRGWVGYCR